MVGKIFNYYYINRQANRLFQYVLFISEISKWANMIPTTLFLIKKNIKDVLNHNFIFFTYIYLRCFLLWDQPQQTSQVETF